MKPLLIIAELSSPCVTSSPLLFDGLLMFGVGRMMGLKADGWVDPAEVYSQPLPLDRVETEHGWWYAASQATPVGVEERTYSHRRASPSQLADWTCSKSVNRASGPDKNLRTPVYYYWAWRTVVWTAIGDSVEVAALLAHIPSVGARTTQGWGRVISWDVRTVEGPPLESYATDISLRHIPVAAVTPGRARVSRRNIPLTPPYHDRDRAEPCWQTRVV